MAERRQIAAARAWPAWPSMVLRCVSALVGGYAATSAMVSLISRITPVVRVEATGWAMILSFPVMASLGLWAFHEPRTWRVAVIIWGVFAVCLAILVGLGPRP